MRKLFGVFLFLVFLTDGLRAKELDVVVYGGTPGGIAAAVMAAREGSSVLLIEPKRHVGGMSTSGLTTAETEHMLKWTLGGFADEFYRRLGRHYKLKNDRPAYEFESYLAEKEFLAMLSEAKVEVCFGAHLEKVEKKGTRIRSLQLTDETTHAAKVFVDASYEGDLMAMSGVRSRYGREARDEYQESFAGIRFDPEPYRAAPLDTDGQLLSGVKGWRKDFTEGAAHPGVMNYNFRLIATRNPEFRVPFPKPKNYDPSRYQLLANWLREEGENLRLGKIIGLYGRRNSKFEMNNRQAAVISLGHFGGQFNWPAATPKEREAIFEDHLDYTLGFFHFLATEEVVPEKIRKEMQEVGLHSGEFADNGHFPYQLYGREGRRMIGSYVMRQQDVRTERRKKDSIGMGSHFIDAHHVQRLAVSPMSFLNEGRIWQKGYAYQIPYRAITPGKEECSNLLVPVAASFTHVAYCTLRVEGTWMVTGHASGIAASLAAKEKVPVQEVPVKKLQAKLKVQKQVIDFIPGQPEKCEKLNGPPEF